MKNERSDDYESVSTRSPVQVKQSKIPRAKITALPTNTLQEFNSVAYPKNVVLIKSYAITNFYTIDEIKNEGISTVEMSLGERCY